MNIDLKRLNELNDLLASVNESWMNVTWNGEPADRYVRQLASDTIALSQFVQKIRDEAAEDLDATFDSDHEKFVIIG